ncbi:MULTISPECIES: fatty acid desaturase [unclassified Fusibacter]|uniref:fatty acid desaturase n=1 Tax=unclassified Fusibacter TaxID=2624464 RepID=UPI0010125663|nr:MULTISPECIES: fatty acid desaturase [unclassified Fusibacter]MCK8058742.1 fatty acid desaturase [Fusibacter sp. A2]NPE21816.1 fatty acid desaturase [Fusibacter sp. A1]RXV61388.1 fatty acid desaturase [Fusibacter sp. A1]
MITNEWRQRLKPFAKPKLSKSIVQIVNTVLPYFALLTLMGIGIYFHVPYILILLLAIPTGAFMVRTFILFHDCTHLSFFKSMQANHILGHLLSILTFTPYTIWQSEHNQHHGAVGNLDERGIGDVWTMTVDEYLDSSRLKRFLYRLYRNPLFLFFVAPFFLFAVLNRLPSKRYTAKKHHLSQWITNTGIAAVALLVSLSFGIKYYLMIQIPVLFFASVMGVWLFFVQHQFEEVYWERHGEWDFLKAAIDGSSFYKLPLVLEWMTGYIGYHHIHHLNPRIPNYNLKACYKEIHEFKNARTITLFHSFRLALLNLYDEKAGKLIRIRDLRRKLNYN